MAISFKDVDNSEYGVLATNLWQKHFKMYELHEIMRQRESKLFAEILNRLREGNHTQDDILKIKERLIQQNIPTYPSDAPHLFIQNAKVNDFNEKVHTASTNMKYMQYQSTRLCSWYKFIRPENKDSQSDSKRSLQN